MLGKGTEVVPPPTVKENISEAILSPIEEDKTIEQKLTREEEDKRQFFIIQIDLICNYTALLQHYFTTTTSTSTTSTAMVASTSTTNTTTASVSSVSTVPASNNLYLKK